MLCLHSLGSQALDGGAADASADAKRPKLNAPLRTPSLAPLAAPPQVLRAAAPDAEPAGAPAKPTKSLKSPPSSKRAVCTSAPVRPRAAQDLSTYDDDDDFADD
jgi:hypothetical protein